MSVSTAFQTFATQAPAHHTAWMTAVRSLAGASTLDERTDELAYVAVLAATGLHSGLPFHVQRLRELGATREEVVSAVLVGLPAVGNGVVSALPVALEAYDA
ncbi:carboxymuconolactone decarboxylase family protein [Cellulomonas sp. PhB150]|uniref:carboxymuconolactone decarboxylase family protein n=1 Tax=Cellulomonas sp. PhB150 TaxID=2485188 RepID=UPI000F486CA6|nr:carboxymuconolactone decarboxylase family protein [Cellulomonas sp. PhB150]ROS28252.1 AhpD family alkylhydroperoxidase [Cellulomonas sp. PhB150]